ncbi:exodeoxyribonuclease VII large subunit [Clostridium intestinale]|uniref:Exodeoxyribonuclease 7 large subunit n=1 Tax=Clostridium intestinale URNW TaxID=1294142 RepID=U2N5J1_9CLOT|nr:exodeoxyribonuclease VII large subunit [Clostridium intestinale]ERK30782.1 exodeoxyribonuclease VII large subunit [Clostridium intestinale URNW]
MKMKVLKVTEVNSYIKRIFDNDFILSNLSVEGEISNLKYHSSGHIYFSLKDENSKINCVMFKSDAINVDFKLADGIKIIVKCRLSNYVKDGSYQLYIKEISESGLGSLHIQFENLKKKLNEEGLFSEDHKKEIPKFIRALGVITSPTGAAIKDIINVTKRRNDNVDIIIYPALVQGAEAYKTLISGIQYFNKTKNVDAVIIGRGGGSLEELWAFNDESLAREIYKSKIPVISAVGHEVDFTICDFVADIRAATPSSAAEIAIVTKESLREELFNIKSMLNKSINKKLDEEKNNLNNIKRFLHINSPQNIIINSYNTIDGLKWRLNKTLKTKIDIEKEIIFRYNKLLQANNPISILDKGFSVIKDSKGNTIKSKEDLKDGVYEIILKDGIEKRKINTLD